MEDRFRFRAWDTIRKQMVTENDIIGEGCNFIPTIAFTGEFWAFDLESSCNGGDPEGIYKVMQCTGLKDKNGKLIYEGDILKQTEEYSVFKKGELEEVSYEGDSGGFYPFAGLNCSDCYESNKMEVIGNIHENPELLTKAEAE